MIQPLPSHPRWFRTLSRRLVESNGCWLYPRRTPAGYGSVAIAGHQRCAHRAVYELLVAPVPKNLDLDHLCRTPACVNPAHMEPVTHAENIRRGFAAKRAAAKAAA